MIHKASEHGLGHLLNPTDPNDDSRDWITEAWRWMHSPALGGHPIAEPAWLDRPALSRLTASGPIILGWFDVLNEGLSYGDQVKPANFLLVAHPDPYGGGDAQPVAPYESDPTRWSELAWIDRRNGQPIAITTDVSDRTWQDDLVTVRTYRSVLTQYLAHPEAKSWARKGGSVRHDTRGLLLRRPVEAILPVHHIGKEGNRIDDRALGLVDGPADYRTEYIDPARTLWSELVVPVLRTVERRSLAERSGLHRRSIERLFAGSQMPHPATEARLTRVAIDHAKETLRTAGESLPRGDRAMLHACLSRIAPRACFCRRCGKRLIGRQSVWCSDACRKRRATSS